MHYFVSDLHLRDPEQENYQVFLQFLKRINSPETKSLFLLGDIFDLWVADHKCFVETYEAIVAAIHNLVKAGIEVYYFEGNHDLYLKKFWQDTLGCRVYLDEFYINLDGLKIRLEHGDLANPEDKSYLLYRKTLRSRFLTWLAYRVPGKLIQDLGLKASKESRKTSSSKRANVESILDTYVIEKYKEKPFDVFISGHFHVRFDKPLKVQNHTIRNINLGWWFEERKVLVLDKGELNWQDADT